MNPPLPRQRRADRRDTREFHAQQEGHPVDVRLLGGVFPSRCGVVVGEAPHANALTGHARRKRGHVHAAVVECE